MKKFSTCIAITVIFSLMLALVIPVSAIIDLGPFTEIENEGMLCGWMTSVEALGDSTQMYIEFENEVDNIIFIFFGDGNGWDWVEHHIDVFGTSVLIDLTELETYEDVMLGSTVKIMVTIGYSVDLAEVGLSRALSLEAGEAVPEAVPVSDNIAASDDGAADAGDAGAPSADTGTPAPAARPAPKTGDSLMIVLLALVAAAAFMTVKKVRAR